MTGQLAASHELAGADPAVRPFGLVLIGAGRIGSMHLRAIRRSSVIQLAAVVEPRPDVRAELESTGVTCFADLADLTRAAAEDDTVQQPEGVLIAAPTTRHLDLVEESLRAGLAVLCEKPCGLTVEQTRACAAAADTAGQFLQVAYWRRYVHELQELREQILSGALGRVLAVECSQWDQSPPPDGFRAASGGIFVDMGVHEFDQARWLTGQEITGLRAVSARPGMMGPSPDTDCGQAIGVLEGGGTVHINLGRWHPAGDMCRVEVYGSAGTVTSTFLSPENADHVLVDALAAQLAGFAEAARRHARRSEDGYDLVGGRGASVGDAVAALSLASQASDSARQC